MRVCVLASGSGGNSCVVESAGTRVLVDVEDYRGRRERQLVEIAKRASERVVETGKMLQLEPMSALERRWIHIALRDNPDVVTQSIGEEPNRRIVVLPRSRGRTSALGSARHGVWRTSPPRHRRRTRSPSS